MSGLKAPPSLLLELQLISINYRFYSEPEFKAHGIWLDTSQLMQKWLILNGDKIAKDNVCITDCQHGEKSSDIIGFTVDNDKLTNILAEMGKHTVSELKDKMNNSFHDQEFILYYCGVDFNINKAYLFLNVVKGRNSEMSTLKFEYITIGGVRRRVYLAYQGQSLENFIKLSHT